MTSEHKPKLVQKQNTFSRNDISQEKPVVQQSSENSLQASPKSVIPKAVLLTETPSLGAAKKSTQPAIPIPDSPQIEKPAPSKTVKERTSASGILNRETTIEKLSSNRDGTFVKTTETAPQELRETTPASVKQRIDVEYSHLGYARQAGLPIPALPKHAGSKPSILKQGAVLGESINEIRDIPISRDNMSQTSDDKNSSKTFTEQKSMWKPSQAFRTNWQLTPNAGPEIAPAPPTSPKRHAEQQSTRTTSLPRGAEMESVTRNTMPQSAPKEISVLGNSLTTPTEDWNIRNLDGGVETFLHSRLAMKEEQLQELRALVDRVFKSSQPLRLDKGSGLKFVWSSKEWGQIKFTIGQFDQEIVAKVKVKSLEVQALLETHSDKLQKLFADQGLRLDRLEIESTANSKLSTLPEVNWDEPRRQRGRSDASTEQQTVHLPDTEAAPPAQAGRQQSDRHVWIA